MRFPSDAQFYRVSRHARSIMVERGLAADDQAALNRIQHTLADPPITYASHRHPGQFKVQDGNLVIVVDTERRSIPTVFVSGHSKSDEQRQAEMAATGGRK